MWVCLFLVFNWLHACVCFCVFVFNLLHVCACVYFGCLISCMDVYVRVYLFVFNWLHVCVYLLLVFT